MMRLVPATADQKPLIANLLQLYLYDMTESMPFPVGSDGRFEYDFLDRFWQSPYLILSGDEIAGFALVIDQCPLTGRSPCFFMAEYFVLKAYRKQGLGRFSLDSILANHPGNWHIGVPHANQPAQAFWGRALAPRHPIVSEITFEGNRWRLHALAV